QAVVERARRVQAELDALVSDVASLRHEVSGNVRLGLIGTTARWLVPRLLTAMCVHHPDVPMVIVEAAATSLEPQPSNGLHGPAVLPATAIPRWLQGDWRVVRVRGLGRRSVGLALRRRGRPAAPARALMQLLDEVVAVGISEQQGLHPPAVG